MIIFKTTNLAKVYGNSSVRTPAIRNISFEINDRDFIGIVGASGSGKSTLLNLLSGIDIPSSGQVIYKNIEIYKMNVSSRARLRRREFGFVFQNYCLISYLTVEENIALPTIIDGKSPDNLHMNRLIKLLGLSNKCKDYPNMLSGGQQQRVAIARALCSKPSVLFADEPTGNLDSSSGRDVINLIRDIYNEYKLTVVIATHDAKIETVCNRVIQINDGVITNDFVRGIK